MAPELDLKRFSLFLYKLYMVFSSTDQCFTLSSKLNPHFIRRDRETSLQVRKLRQMKGQARNPEDAPDHMVSAGALQGRAGPVGAQGLPEEQTSHGLLGCSSWDPVTS